MDRAHARRDAAGARAALRAERLRTVAAAIRRLTPATTEAPADGDLRYIDEITALRPVTIFDMRVWYAPLAKGAVGDIAGTAIGLFPDEAEAASQAGRRNDMRTSISRAGQVLLHLTAVEATHLFLGPGATGTTGERNATLALVGRDGAARACERLADGSQEDRIWGEDETPCAPE